MLLQTGEERAIVSIIQRRQRAWLGHTLHHGGQKASTEKNRNAGHG